MTKMNRIPFWCVLSSCWRYRFRRPNSRPRKCRSSFPGRRAAQRISIFRALAATTGKYLGKAVVIVNKPGGGGAVGYTEGAKAEPDGYTLTSAVTPLTILPHQVKTAFTYKNFDADHQRGRRSLHVPGEGGRPVEELQGVPGVCAQEPGHDHRRQLRGRRRGASGGPRISKGGRGEVQPHSLLRGRSLGDGPARRPCECGLGLPARGDQSGPGGKAPHHCPVCGQEVLHVPGCAHGEGAGDRFCHGHVARPGGPKGTPPDVIKKLHDAFKKGMEDPAFTGKAKDMAVNVAYMGPEPFGKLIARDHDFYGNLIKELK